MTNRLQRVVAARSCWLMILTASVAHAEEILTCESGRGRYEYCRIETSNHVSLRRQLSNTPCELDDTWGYDRHGIWVDHGCRAEFTVGRDERHHGNKDAAVAVGAVAGIAILAAIASNAKAQRQAEVPSWAVGTFSGRDDVENMDVQITIVPGGSVTGFVGRNHLSGRFNGTQLQTGRYRFRVERAGSGFSAVDEADSRHRVNFVRIGAGY